MLALRISSCLRSRARGRASTSGAESRTLISNGLLVLSICAPLLMTGCNAIFWGNLGVLCVTVGIFLGTVFLSRSSTATRSAAARSVAPGTAPGVTPPSSHG